MVVFFEGREPIGFDRMKPKTIWQCRHGAFHHDEIIGKPFGSRVSDTRRFSLLASISSTEMPTIEGGVVAYLASSYLVACCRVSFGAVDQTKTCSRNLSSFHLYDRIFVSKFTPSHCCSTLVETCRPCECCRVGEVCNP